jgi:hypothetical protein
MRRVVAERGLDQYRPCSGKLSCDKITEQNRVYIYASKEIEGVLQELETLGWNLIEGKGHCWGILRCPADPDCRCGAFCQISVWSTPKSPQQHARKLRQKALACVRLKENDEGCVDG